MPLDWRVEKMRLSKERTQLRYDGFLTLDGIPGAGFDYQLGNRSEDPQYVARLIGKVVSVSLETVAGLPALGVAGEEEGTEQA